MSQTVTLEEGRAYVFVAVEHANSEIVGIHAARTAINLAVVPAAAITSQLDALVFKPNAAWSKASATSTFKVNEMWGTGMSQTVTLEEGRAYVFVAVTIAYNLAEMRRSESRSLRFPWRRRLTV
jgi:hypothetical protein